MFILIAMVCSLAINMTYMEEPTQNMYKFILAISTLLSTILWINYMIEKYEQV
jgi:amino acid permease